MNIRRALTALLATVILAGAPISTAQAAWLVPWRVPTITLFPSPTPKALGELRVILNDLRDGRIGSAKAALLIRRWAMRHGLTSNLTWNAIVQRLLHDLNAWEHRKGSGMARHLALTRLLSGYVDELSRCVVHATTPPMPSTHYGTLF